MSSYTEQNGCVERKHKHIVEIARTLLVAFHVSQKYWVEALSIVMYLINMLPIYGIAKSPKELLFHKPRDYSILKIFSCSCYPWLKPYVSSKLDGKSKKCVFLGYSLQHKAYRCLDPITSRVYISHHVLFDDTLFPFHNISPTSPLLPITSSVSTPMDLTFHSQSSFVPASTTMIISLRLIQIPALLRCQVHLQIHLP